MNDSMISSNREQHSIAVTGASDNDTAPEPPTKKQKLIKAGLFLLLVIIVIYVILDYTVPGLGFVDDILKSFLTWVEDNPAQGAIAFAGVYIFTTVCFIPGSLLTLGAGLVFGRALGTGLGVVVGSLAVLVGATIGAILAFLLGRFVLQQQAQGLFNKFKVLTAVNRAIQSQGLKLVILLRLSPVVPFSAFNYVMGVTAVKFRDYALGCVGFIPGTVAFVFIGTTASGLLGDDGEEEETDDDGSNGTVQLIVLIVGGIATVIAVVLVSIYSKRALNKVLEEDRIAHEDMEAGGEVNGSAATTRGEGVLMERPQQDGTRPSAIEHAVRMPV
ncbi:unnamed protein product [Pylaiella littoralis]